MTLSLYEYYNDYRDELDKISPDTWRSLEIQFMDQLTANKLFEIGNPELTKITDLFCDFVPFKFSEIIKYLPDESDFLDPNHYQTIHGVIHLSRVIVYAMILSQLRSLGDNSTNIVAIAAGRHDIGRLDDRDDKEHGLRSGNSIRANAKMLLKNRILRDEGSIDEIALISKYHEYPYELIPAEDREKYAQTLDILMHADALDRFRLQRTKWWPKVEFLRLDEARKLLQLAKYFTLRVQKNIYEEIPFGAKQISNSSFRNLTLTKVHEVGVELGIFS